MIASIGMPSREIYAVEEYHLMAAVREMGKPAFALMADRKTSKYVGSAFINTSRAIRERLWHRSKPMPARR
ncbi:hypothetical protein [Mesorhizobium sp. INR15]|uniref:hypothetical protein n=1 Tax=Mesorhizobium sp. INR15 TaxID=2654248 RepID=UPI0021565BF3|nr:hypothetical protein [Mesorhizobium sp. INR15]